MVVASDIKFYHSLTADGGDIDINSEIISGNLNSFIPDVSGVNTEAGVIKYTKFYIKNTHATDTAFLPGLALSTFSLGDDYFVLYESTNNNTVEGNETFTRGYGVARCTGNAHNNLVPIEFEDPSMYTDIFKPSDTVVFFNPDGSRKYKATIDTVTSTSLTTVENINGIALDTLFVGTTIDKASLAPGDYIGVWLKQIVLALSAEYLSNSMNITFYFDPE